MSTEQNQSNNTDGAIVAKGKNFKLVPQGTHLGRCVHMIHIGTIAETYKGNPRIADKVALIFELPDVKRENPQEGSSPVELIMKEYTNSLGSKANLRKDIKSWRGADLTDKEVNEGWDITRLVYGKDREKKSGVAAMISVTHSTTTTGNTYANISAIMGVPASTSVPAQINPSKVFSYSIKDDKAFVEAFNQVPKFLQEKIKKSDEWKAREKSISGMLATLPAAQAAPQVQGSEDDLPF